MKDFVNEAKQKYDVVLLDSPPVLTSSDSAVMGTYVDGVIMVYKVGQIARGAIKRAKAQLEAVKAKVIGVVLNGVKPEISTDYDTFKYGYYYYSSDSHDINESSGGMLPFPKALRKKLEKSEDMQGSTKNSRWSDKKTGIVRCILLILLLTSLVGAIIWQQFRPEETQLSHSATRKKILLPQEVSKTPSKSVTKVPVVEKEINGPLLPAKKRKKYSYLKKREYNKSHPYGSLRSHRPSFTTKP